MLMKRCGGPSGFESACLIPGNWLSSASKSSFRFSALTSAVSAPPVNFRSGGGILIFMTGIKPPIQECSCNPPGELCCAGGREVTLFEIGEHRANGGFGGKLLADCADGLQTVSSDGQHGGFIRVQ